MIVAVWEDRSVDDPPDDDFPYRDDGKSLVCGIRMKLAGSAVYRSPKDLE